METANIVKEAAKKAILSVINGGSGDHINHPYLVSLKAEMAIVHGFIVNLNPSYYKIAKRQKEAKDSTFNINGSTVNMLLCDIENDLIQEVCEKLSSMGYTIGSLQFDGVLVRKHQTLKLTDEVLREITDTIYSQTGYRISLKVKPMDAGFSVPAEAVANPEPMQDKIAQDEEEASELFLKQIEPTVKKSKGRIFARDANGIWTDNKRRVDDLLLVQCLSSNIMKVSAKGETIPYSGKVSAAKYIIEATLAKMEDVDDFVRVSKQSCMGYVCFKNGVYNLRTKEFKRYSEVPNVMSMVSTNRSLGARDLSMIEKIHTFLDSIFGDAGRKQTWLEHMARSMGGHVADKWWALMRSERNGGKGVLQSIVQYAFGQYVNTINGNEFLVERINSGDAAKKQAFMMDCEFSRVTFTSEISFDVADKHIKINGNLLKKFASGGDVINARRNFQDASEFTIGSSLNIMCNDFPPIEPRDAIENAIAFNLPFKFMSESEMGDNPLPSFKLRDDGIKEWVAGDEVLNAFTYILFDSYKPHRVVLSATSKADLESEKGEEAADEMSVVRRWIHYSDDSADRVTNAQVKEFRARYKLNTSDKRMKDLLARIGGIPYVANGVRGYTNLRLVVEEVEEEQ